MTYFDELDHLRGTGTRALALILWICVAIIAAGTNFSDQGWAPLITALALACLPTYFVVKGRHDATTRLIFGATLPLYAGILLFQWAGRPWQADMHMLFFALLATLIVLYDWRAIAAGTVVTALHHLGIDIAMPLWVFPEGASYMRVLMHAVIVLVETGVLIRMVIQLDARSQHRPASGWQRRRWNARSKRRSSAKSRSRRRCRPPSS